ncbi:hypothetical protein [Streptomyces sp. NPDC090994]|uniref:hypothetical protein n=1 Tax=Streptomyces sp. NPDC090994 TaxID=3365969 RepID=UPI0037FDA7E5
MTTLNLTLLGALREITAAELPSATSPHSGRPLRRYALRLHVPDERHQELDAELRAAAAADGDPLRGTDAAWRVAEGWTAASQGRRPEIYVYRIEIQEIEVLHPTALEIEGLRLVPAKYRERADEDVLTVTAVADVTGADDQRLERLLSTPGAWYEVTRRGISDTPVRMRFGRCVWQRTGEGTRRHHLELVAGEDRPSAAPPETALAGQPRLDRAVERLMAHTDALARLLKELHTQGVLSDSAVRAVEAAAAPRPLTPGERRELSRTERLDDYWR